MPPKGTPQPSPLTIYLGADEAERRRLTNALDQIAEQFGCKSRSDLVRKIADRELIVAIPTPANAQLPPETAAELSLDWETRKAQFPCRHRK